MVTPVPIRRVKGTATTTHALVAAVASCMALVVAVTPAAAQEADAHAEARRQMFDAIAWADGPAQGRLGSVAEVRVPAGCRFTERNGAKAFMEATQNPPSGREQGVLLCTTGQEDAAAADSERSTWFVVYSYNPSGYVRDDEQGKLDADAILASLRDGTEAGNRERRSRGWEPLSLEGWVRPPFYDPATHNLTWSTQVRSASDGPSVNHSVRLLGRGGVMHADLVVSPEQLATTLGRFDQVVAGTTFSTGETYGEWREGDKVAEYGLTALVAGGAGAAAVKLGFFGKMWKVLLAIVIGAKKLVFVAVLGGLAWLKSLFKKRDSSVSASGGSPGASSAGPAV